jgi:hypothetical protein
MELQLPGPEPRLPHVEADEATDDRGPGQSAQDGLAEEPRHAGDHHRAPGMWGLLRRRAAGAVRVRDRYGVGILEWRGGVTRSLHAHRLAA